MGSDSDDLFIDDMERLYTHQRQNQTKICESRVRMTCQILLFMLLFCWFMIWSVLQYTTYVMITESQEYMMNQTDVFQEKVSELVTYLKNIDGFIS